MATNFAELMEQERTRLTEALVDVDQRMTKLTLERTALEREMLAVDAYERVKNGTTPSTTPSGRSARGSRAQTLLALIGGTKAGMTRAQILASVGAKGNKSEEGSISNALTNLKKQGHLTLAGGTYTVG